MMKYKGYRFPTGLLVKTEQDIYILDMPSMD